MLSTIYFFAYQAKCVCTEIAGVLHATIHRWLILVSYRLQQLELVTPPQRAAMRVWHYLDNELRAEGVAWLLFVCHWRRRENLARLGKQAGVLLICLLMPLPSFTQAEAPGLLLGACLLAIAVCLGCAALLLGSFGTAFSRWRKKTGWDLASLLPLAILGAAIVTCVPAHAQTQIPDVTTDPTFETGIRQYGSYHGGKIDTINLSNGSLTADIPLIFYPQRGGKLKLNFVLHYFDEGWFADQQCGLTQCFLTGRGSWFHGWALIETDEPATPSNAGPGLGGISGSTVGGPSCTPVQGTSPQQYLCVASIVMPDGAVHTAYPIGLTTFMAVDGSGYRLDTFPGKLPGTSSFYITDADGIRYSFGPNFPGNTASPPNMNSQLNVSANNPMITEDPNGNQIINNGSSWTDSLGRVIPASFSAPQQGAGNCPAGPLPVVSNATWNPPGLNSGTYPILFCYVNVAETIPAGVGLNGNPSYSATAIQSVVLPNGHSWTCQYTSDGFGDLQQITFPTGGTLSYTWTSGIQFPVPLGGSSHTDVATRAVATRILNPNDGITAAGKWQYSYASNFTGNPMTVTTTVTDPGGDDTVHTLTSLATARAFEETQTRFFQGSSTNGGTVAESQQISYSFQPVIVKSCNSLDVANVLPISTTTTWANGQQAQTQTGYDGGFLFYPCPLWNTSGGWDVSEQTLIGLYGRVTARSQSDFGNGAPGSVIMTTSTAYQFASKSAFLNNNLLNLPASVYITDGLGNTAAVTTYGYDETALAPSGISNQHDASPPAGATPGNLTSVNRALNTTGKNVTTKVSWLDTGVMAKQIDPMGNATTYSYESSGAYPNQVCNPLNQCSSMSYDLNTGLVLSITDINNQTTSYSYDTALRPTQITYPPTPVNGTITSGQSNFSYPDAVTVQIQEQVDSSNTRTSFLQVDGLGRLIREAVANGESSNPYDQSDTCYDAFGRVGFKPYTYQGAGLSASRVCSGTGDSLAYDALGRPTSVTHSDGTAINTSYSGSATSVTDETGVRRVSQTDGLGRLISVCEVTSATQMGSSGAPAACNQAIAATGFLTTYSYDALGNLVGVSQPGLSSRSFSYDSLSRLISASNPESGTVLYAYDSNGNLLNKVAPAPNQTGAATVSTDYVYDPLNRLTKKSYSDGTMPTVSFLYDADSNWTNPSATQTNLAGRLSQESTINSSGALITGSVFSYDAMGRVLANNQCTPFTCGTGDAAINYGYDLLGDPLSATNGAGVAFSYNNNSAGRLSSVSTSLNDIQHPSTLFSNAHYGPFGLTQALLGNGFSVARGYDMRGRLQSETDSIPAAPATVSVTVAGAERTTQVLTQAATSATGSVTIAGSLQAPLAIANPASSTTTGGTSAITITGAEQQLPAGRTPGTGNLTISGAEQVIPATTASGNVSVNGTLQWAATGSVTIGGAEQSRSGVGAAPATPGAGSVTLGGPGEQSGTQTAPCDGVCYTTVFDGGQVWITINGSDQESVTYQGGYVGCVASHSSGWGGDVPSAATYLANCVTANSPYVTATASGATIYITAKNAGPNTNYSLSAGSTYDAASYCVDTSTSNSFPCFAQPSITATPFASKLTGGTDANPGTTVYDAGTCKVTVNGTDYKTDFGANDNNASIATRLASAINGGSFAYATASGGTISLVSKTPLSGGAFSLSSSCTYDTTYFSSASFSATSSTSSLSASNPFYDSGTCTITANSHPDTTTTWSGSGTTTAAIAASLVSKITSDTSAFVSASAPSGSPTVSLKAGIVGASGNYSLSSSCSYDAGHFSSPSFTTSNSGSALAGGKNAIYDAGTITATVNNHADSYSFGQADTPVTIATGLAGAINKDTGASVTATASGATVNLTATTLGSISNYSLSVGGSYDSSDFSKASFTAAASGTALTGGTPNNFAIDQGTVTVSIGGKAYSVNFGKNDTPGSIASNLVTALMADSTIAPTLSGSTLLLNPKTPGTSYSLSATYSYDSVDFTAPSFTPAEEVYDYGTAAITAGSVTDKVYWSYGSTATSLASALADAVNADSSAVVKATPSAGTISLIAKTTGSATNYAMASAVTYDLAVFSSSSFSASPSGSALAGGQNAVYTPDSDKGNVAITISDPAITTYTNSVLYGASDTPNTVASALANLLHNDANSPVDATASGATVSLSTRSAGMASDYSFAINSATTDSNFSGTSFPVTPGSGSLTGGIDAFHYSFSLGYAGNGNLLSANDSVNGNWAYSYDNFNRLATANKDSGQSGYSYVYDQLGNRWQQNVTAGTGNAMVLTFSGSNNRMDGYSYDAAGNLLNDGHHSYIYDAENRIISVDNGQTASYVYDAEGRRVRKVSAAGTVDYLYDLVGHAMVELNSSAAWNRVEVFAAGRHLATYNGGPSGTTLFAHADWLGTERARTNLAGAMCETVISLPFGDGQTSSGMCDPTPLHFTGKERDTESGLDNFGKRYFGSSLGRFQTPDPVLISWRRMVNPQLWNAYSYVGNNPLRFVDPTGEELVPLGQHTDDQIDKRTKEINKELKNKNLTKDQKNALKAEKNTLSLEKEGNHVVANMLSKLDQTGQRNGLQVSDFTLSTDTKNDFAGLATPGAMKKLLNDQAFVLAPSTGLGGTIYIRTEPEMGFYQLSQRNSDFAYYGAADLAHEQVHLLHFDWGERPAWQRQDEVFHGFKNFFQNPDTYKTLDESIHEGIKANQ